MVVSLLCLVFSGCAHYTLQVPEPNSAGQTHTVTMFAYLGGAIERKHIAHECDITHCLDMVRVKDNLAYDLLSVITLGLVKPIEVEYKCSAGQTKVGDPITAR